MKLERPGIKLDNTNKKKQYKTKGNVRLCGVEVEREMRSIR